MNSQTNDKINQLRQELAALEAQAAKEREATLKSLPEAAGVKTMEELVLLLLPYTNLRVVASRKSSETAPSDNAEKKGKRAKITDELKKEMEKLLRAGDMTIKQISEKLGVSAPTVNIFKKKLGLTKARA